MRKFVHQLAVLRNSLIARLMAGALLPLFAGTAMAQLLDPNIANHVFAQAPSSSVSQTPRPVLDGTAAYIGHYDPTKMLRLALSLNLPHPAEEAQFLADLQNKQSPLFHQYPSSEEWDSRFGPSVEDEQTVVDWAQSQGLTVTFRYPNRLILDLEAPAGVIEKAFQLTINSYQHRFTDGSPAETVFSNDRDPTLPSNVDRIVHGVHGLNSFMRYRPASRLHSHVPRPDYIPGPVSARGESAAADAMNLTDSGPASALSSQSLGTPATGFYGPADIWSAGAYDYLALMEQGHCCNPTGNAHASTPTTSIAIVTLGNVNFDDIALFRQTYPTLAYNLQKYNVDGGYGTCAANDDNCLEVTLDTEWSLATSNSRGSAADTAKIFLYEAPNNVGDLIDVFNQMLTDGFARTFTMSFSCAEQDDCIDEGTMQDQDKVFAKMVGMGWTLVSDSGDQGSTGACDDKLLVRFPASDPYVIAAGGTGLQLNSNDTFLSETDWTGGTTAGSCVNNNGGSTGGFSSLWPSPAYQSSFGNGFSMRVVPDLALNAEFGQVIVFNGAFAYVGGTSVVSPMLAGFFAQENAYLLSIGNACGSNGTSPCAPLGDAHYPIYGEATDPTAGHFPFYDITSGCSSNDITAEYGIRGYCATKGFDLATGWGAANMLQLAWAINWEITAANGLPNTTFSGPAVNKWYNSNQNVSWTINDYTAGKPVGTGIAGFNQGWDSIPTDSTTEPHGQTSISTNTFYTGPQFRNTSTGCLALASGEACSGGVTQGCHTAHVRGWNNQGFTTGNSTYGPICYDTIAPTTTIGLSGTFIGAVYTSSVSVTLSASDPGAPTTGSGIKATYFTINGELPGQYIGPFTLQIPGTYTVGYYSSDEAGNVGAKKTVSFTIVPPATFTTTLSATALSFGSETVDKVSAAQVVTVTNSGSATLTFSSIKLGGSQADDFSMTTTCGSSLAASASCTIAATFTPVSAGAKSASISLSDNSGGSPYTVVLSGTGVAAASSPAVKLSATTLAFANQAAKTTSAAKSVTLTNSGSGALSITGISLTGGQTDDFTLSKTCGSTLAGGASCTISVAFSPVSTGAKSASISISDSASGSPQTVTLSGTGVTGSTPSVTLSATTLSFPNQAVKTTSAAKTVTLTNGGSGPLSLTSIALGGGQADDFSFSKTCGSTLSGGASCTISVTFTPVSAGAKAASIAISDNASGSPQIISLAGAGV